jgi:hypothetical protein
LLQYNLVLPSFRVEGEVAVAAVLGKKVELVETMVDPALRE